VRATELLRDLVQLESPTGDADRIGRIGDRIVSELVAVGATVERLGPHLRAELGPALDGRRPLLVLTHMDTVWPAGTLAAMPFRVEGDWAHGPGAFDMKAGIVTMLQALREAAPLRRPVVALVTADEEVGSPDGREHVRREAAAAAAALVLEPPIREGTITTGRSGLARYQLDVTGRAAHAGHAGGGGVSAIEELAHQVLALHALADHARGVRVNVGQIGGGTGDNVVAGEAWARIDARAWTAEGQAELEGAIRGLEPQLDGVTLRVTGGVTRPPMKRTPATARLAARAIAIAERLGVPIAETVSGGGSDGNFAATAGAPVLDGLGPVGAGAHAVDERVSLVSLAERTRLLTELLRAL
jgi:glutamate carboxypeptidase